MAEELKFAVKCRASTRRPVFKRRCSPCLTNQGLSYSSPGIFGAGHQSNNCSHNHRYGLPDHFPPIIHSTNSSPSVQTKVCNHHQHHVHQPYHNHSNNLGPNVFNLPSSFNYTECHSPSTNARLYLNRSKSVGAPPMTDTYSTSEHYHHHHHDYNLENDSGN